MSRTAVLSLLFAALPSACQRAPDWPPSPAELRPGEEACAECRMLVSDARFAVQAHSRAGGVEWFDDLGCLLAGSERVIEPPAVFVRDFAADLWVRGDQGHAALVPGLDSPMGYGWSVHASAADGRAAARAEGARLVDLSELLLQGRPDAPPRAHEATATTNADEDPR